MLSELAEIPRCSAVYCIVCVATGESYVGCSEATRTRVYAHLSLLRSGRHPTPRMQELRDAHGDASFVVLVLWRGRRKGQRLAFFERKWIRRLMPSLNRDGFAKALRRHGPEHQYTGWYREPAAH